MAWELNKQGRSDLILVDIVEPSARPKLLGNTQFVDFLSLPRMWDLLATPAAKSITQVIHMGANSSTTEKNWEHLYENNFLTSMRLFQWCAQNNVPLIYASSAATYGAGELGYSDQLDPQQLHPLNLYGKSKVIMDQWVIRQEKTPPHWYGVKFFNVYGPNELYKGPMASLVQKSFSQILETGKIQLFQSYRPEFADGEQKRDFIYVKDSTRMMWDLMQRKPVNGLYNFGSGKARSWNDLAKAVFAALNKETNIKYIEMPKDLRDQYQYFTEAPMNKWTDQGLSGAQWSLEAGIKDYVLNYLQKNEVCG